MSRPASVILFLFLQAYPAAYRNNAIIVLERDALFTIKVMCGLTEGNVFSVANVFIGNLPRNDPRGPLGLRTMGQSAVIFAFSMMIHLAMAYIRIPSKAAKRLGHTRYLSFLLSQATPEAFRLVSFTAFPCRWSNGRHRDGSILDQVLLTVLVIRKPAPSPTTLGSDGEVSGAGTKRHCFLR